MKIAFIGNFSVDFSSESHYLKTFRKLGHEVHTIQENTVISPSDREFALSADIFFWVHTHGWWTKWLDELLGELREKKIPIVGYHLDLWLGIERQKDLENDSYWKWMDYFFCTDKLMVNWLNDRNGQGYPKAFFLPAGVYENECYMSEKPRKYRYDVIFTGSRNYHPEWPYREKLISWLEKTYGDRFAHFGGGGKPGLRGDDLNRLYASAKIVVGDTLCKDFTYPYYLSDRVFEVTGRGGFLIMPYIKGIEDLFELGRELIVYKFDKLDEDPKDGIMSANSLKVLIDYFLEQDEVREAIRKAGHERTKRDHTYTQRLSKLLDVIYAERLGTAVEKAVDEKIKTEGVGVQS